MSDFNANSHAFLQPSAELWRRTLNRVPSVFGRLALLASLRDAATGRYAHPALSSALGGEETDRTLRQSHHQIFTQWLCLSLMDQKGDLDDYLDEPGAARQFLRYQSLPPSGARDVERQLFFTDLETLLELLEVERGGASPTREA